jgi:AraC-like DNA-binding protein
VEGAKLLLGAAPAAAHRLEAVAAALAISAHHLAHVFRAQVGLSMHRYLLQMRLAAALGELLTSEVSLSTLAFDLGFSSHSHFTARFTRFFGATPSAVRRCMAPQRVKGA